MKPHPDPRYYDCSHPDSHGATNCTGTMGFIGYDSQKKAVYECSVCGRRAGETMLQSAYSQMKRQD
jgi:hypothetical protein